MGGSLIDDDQAPGTLKPGECFLEGVHRVHTLGCIVVTPSGWLAGDESKGCHRSEQEALRVTADDECAWTYLIHVVSDHVDDHLEKYASHGHVTVGGTSLVWRMNLIGRRCCTGALRTSHHITSQEHCAHHITSAHHSSAGCLAPLCLSGT